MLLFAATACSSESGDSAAESTPDTAVDTAADTPLTDTPLTEAPLTDPAVVVPDALQFTAPLVGGGTFDGAAAAGKPTVFWFWAPT